MAKPLKLESLDFIDAPSEYAAEIEAAQKLAKGVYVCKDLVGAPPNVVTPKSLAELAVSIAEEHSDVFKAEVLELPEIEARNMGAYLGVAQGLCRSFLLCFVSFSRPVLLYAFTLNAPPNPHPTNFA